MVNEPFDHDAAYRVLQAAMNAKASSPTTVQRLPAATRASLLKYAEAAYTIRPKTPADANRAAHARLRSTFIAGALATLEGADAPMPFIHHELRRAFREQQQFMRELA